MPPKRFKLGHAKRPFDYSSRIPRIQLFQGNSVRHVRPARARRFAAACGIALGPLELSVKIDPALYSQIIRDDRISHGAHRLWCLLRDMTGNNPCAWPSVNSICKSIHCGKDAAFGWIIELEAAGYMRVERGNQHKSNRYYLNGGSVQNLRGSKQGHPSGSKSGYELNSLIQSKNSGRAARVKAQPPALPEAKEKRVRIPDDLLKTLAASLRAATNYEP